MLLLYLGFCTDFAPRWVPWARGKREVATITACDLPERNRMQQLHAPIFLLISSVATSSGDERCWQVPAVNFEPSRSSPAPLIFLGKRPNQSPPSQLLTILLTALRTEGRANEIRLSCRIIPYCNGFDLARPFRFPPLPPPCAAAICLRPAPLFLPSFSPLSPVSSRLVSSRLVSSRLVSSVSRFFSPSLSPSLSPFLSLSLMSFSWSPFALCRWLALAVAFFVPPGGSSRRLDGVAAVHLWGYLPHDRALGRFRPDRGTVSGLSFLRSSCIVGLLTAPLHTFDTGNAGAFAGLGRGI